MFAVPVAPTFIKSNPLVTPPVSAASVIVNVPEPVLTVPTVYGLLPSSVALPINETLCPGCNPSTFAVSVTVLLESTAAVTFLPVDHALDGKVIENVFATLFADIGKSF